MFGLFERRKSIIDSSLLEGAVDNHCHILYGVDDGVKTPAESYAILKWLEQKGVREVWLTPHVMEDVPNTTEGLRARFEELKAAYKGGLVLHLAAEYMLDGLFEARLAAGDLLMHGEERVVLVETSTIAPPLDLWSMLNDIKDRGYQPLLAHPERYRYMSEQDYVRLHEMDVPLQLNLPSIAGYYGKDVCARAQWLLDKGWYVMTGSDCHRFRVIHHQYHAQELKKKTIGQLAHLMHQ